jgi:anti-sigma B factor antagonist
MTIQKTIDKSSAELKIAGWLDTQTAPELGSALSELGEEIKSLVLNLSELEYISSAGLRQIVAAHKKMGGNLTIKNVSDEIMDVFRMTGFDKHLNIV